MWLGFLCRWNIGGKLWDARILSCRLSQQVSHRGRGLLPRWGTTPLSTPPQDCCSGERFPPDSKPTNRPSSCRTPHSLTQRKLSTFAAIDPLHLPSDNTTFNWVNVNLRPCARLLSRAANALVQFRNMVKWIEETHQKTWLESERACLLWLKPPAFMTFWSIVKKIEPCFKQLTFGPPLQIHNC